MKQSEYLWAGIEQRIMRLVLILSVGLYMQITVNSAELLRVSLTAIKVDAKSNEVWCEVSLKNEGASCYVISKFSIETIIGNTWFHDESGALWLFKQQNILSQPPPFNEDYVVKVENGKTTKVRLKFDGIAPIKTSVKTASDRNLDRPQLQYLCFGEVSAFECQENGRAIRLVSGGRGNIGLGN